MTSRTSGTASSTPAGPSGTPTAGAPSPWPSSTSWSRPHSSFPDYYGRNLDALWDCLTDLAEPTVLLWDGWGPFAHAEPEGFEALLTVLRDRSAARPPFSVLLRGAGPDVDVPSLD